MNNRTFDALELFDFIEMAAQRAQTPAGRALTARLRPSADPCEVRREIEITGECVAYQTVKGRFGLAGVEDLEDASARLHIKGNALEPRQVLAFERLLIVGKELKENILGLEPSEQFPRLRGIATGIPDARPVLAAIRGKVLPNGEIDDNASPELRAIRRDLAERRHRINRTLEAILRTSPEVVQDEIITFRNGRFVIPIRTDSRGRIPGVMHGLSSSGQTTYVEPMQVIDQNNDLVRLHEQEDIEIANIISALTEVFRKNLGTVFGVLDAVSVLDAAQARALVSMEFQCLPPRISDNKEYILTDARHILLERELRKTGGRPVPISMELDSRRNALVISGPNAGGKTVALKTAGLISLMAQMGFHVPAKEAVLPVFGRIFADIGDQQSIAANLSTFTAHMRNIAEMAAEIDPERGAANMPACAAAESQRNIRSGQPALILLDEVGAGTDPDEGAALAIAVIDAFRRAGAVTLASTHYPRLKMWASEVDGVRNASVEFDEHALRPTYRLLLDVAGASSGIEIARRMNIPKEILDAARELVDPDHTAAREYLRRLGETLDEQERLRAALDGERKAVAEKYAALEREHTKREADRKIEFEAALERVIGEFRKESERAVRELKDRVESARARRTAENLTAGLRRKSVRLQRSAGETPAGDGNDAAAPAIVETENIEPGDIVLVRSLNREGLADSVEGDVCVVAFGVLRYRAERGDVEKIKDRKKPDIPQGKPAVSPDDEIFASELNVIGLNADEALDRVDRFLDQAYLAGGESVRIVHGHGKGILRSAIARFLEHHPQAARFTSAPPEKGGSGATVVILKN
ncbi:MAG: Smr/MutS family protein [Acidobacteriota bacterium]|jgi:DNA mismatch repair protein MutS2|nr:Smr/MutS family protein [Acidobacteriota bacterium]